MYGVLPYFLGKTFSEMPVQFIFPIVHSAIIYFAIGLNDDPISKFFFFTLVTVMSSFAGVSLGLLCGCLFSDINVAVGTAPMMVIPFMLFSGYLINFEAIPISLIVFEHISVFKYNFPALI